ncbi:hypothetical protein GCM10025768_15060 [Microbacterium pseudoresistens]|uniref:Uncharacterized protein n=1 Tax=Microbacterium pseudoresistens TaxID=640634 RepID=A0A7Y9ESQ1_9MICO|nr:hypothetical protein [Microbacterium pseudoresistens]NYD53141.1 hypothetical protein [Microbacterium pseudoresistens]
MCPAGTVAEFAVGHTPVAGTDAVPHFGSHSGDMGFFDKITHMFDDGGIDVMLEAPKTFRWSDPSIAVAVTITNGADEQRRVEEVRIQLAEDDRENPVSTQKVRGRYEGLNVFYREPCTIEPGQSRTLRIDVALNATEALDQLGAEVPGWMRGLGKAAGILSAMNDEHEWYLLRAIPSIEGFSAREIGVRRIRNLQAGEFDVGGVQVEMH